MSEPLLNVLKLCLLVLLYLFFFRVVRAVWVEVKAPVPVAASAEPGRERSRRRRRAGHRSPSGLLVVEPGELAGREFGLDGGLTIGRDAACGLTVDDTYVSQTHARVFERDGQVLAEDLGSTNGTYLNQERVTGVMVMRRGDRLQVGSTIVELR